MAAESTSEGEGEAWAAVLAAWDDEAAHRAFLACCRDLDALARAGGRYREVLLARPGDPVASRWRDEVIRRATAAGLASLPREAPAVARVPRWVRPAFLVLLALVVAGLCVALFRTLGAWGRP